MKRFPFSVFKRADRPCYMVSFKNELTGEYLPAISTKQKIESEAVKTAIAWLRDGIPGKGGLVDQGKTEKEAAKMAEESCKKDRII